MMLPPITPHHRPLDLRMPWVPKVTQREPKFPKRAAKVQVQCGCHLQYPWCKHISNTHDARIQSQDMPNKTNMHIDDCSNQSQSEVHQLISRYIQNLWIAWANYDINARICKLLVCVTIYHCKTRVCLNLLFFSLWHLVVFWALVGPFVRGPRICTWIAWPFHWLLVTNVSQPRRLWAVTFEPTLLFHLVFSTTKSNAFRAAAAASTCGAATALRRWSPRWARFCLRWCLWPWSFGWAGANPWPCPSTRTSNLTGTGPPRTASSHCPIWEHSVLNTGPDT